MKIKNIVFDFGGVLLSEDDNWISSDKVQKLLHLEYSDLNKAFDYAWPDARDGKIDENTFFNRFLNKSIKSTDIYLINKLKEIYRAEVSTLEGFTMLHSLMNNYKLFALSNILRDWLDYKIQMFELDTYFESIVSSCNEHIAKPHKEIFLVLVKKNGINPKETLFVDNMTKNIFPARELGFNTILFDNINQCLSEMNKFDIRI